MSDAWTELMETAVSLRRTLHRHPELAWSEFETAKRIRAALSDAGIPWRICAETGTVASLGGTAAGRHIALRADIDGLPIQEASGANWSSETLGLMHACGHDGHTATLIATARWLKSRETQLPGPVSLLFQPAEEGGHGAKRMIEDGALDGVDAIFGWHNWPAIPFGKAVCPDGPVMAANGTFSILVTGKGGHASQPELCRDPVLAASAITMALQHIVSRRLAPQHGTVVSVTSILGPSHDTVIPESVRLGGSFRLSDSSLRGELSELLRQIAEDTARAHGVAADVEILPRYEATVNHRAEAEQFRKVLETELGSGWKCNATLLPVMASEDFSYYLQKIPGAFALVGAGSEGHTNPCHSPAYDFNDALIPVMARVYSQLAGLCQE